MSHRHVRLFAATLTVATLLAGCVKPPTQTPAKGTGSGTVTNATSGGKGASPTGAKAKAGAKVAAASPQVLSHARAGAARTLNLLSVLGNASVKAANHAKGKPAVANAHLLKPGTRHYVLTAYGLLDVSTTTGANGTVTTNGSATTATGANGTVTVDQGASGTTIDASASGGGTVTVDQAGTSASCTATCANDDQDVPDVNVAIVDKGGDEVIQTDSGLLEDDVKTGNKETKTDDKGDTVTTVDLAVSTDTTTGETGDEKIQDVTGADGKLVSSEIDYTPDQGALADGGEAETIKCDADSTDGSANKLDIKLDADPTDTSNDQAEATLEEKADDMGDVTSEGDVALPGGDKLHVKLVVHANGTKDITCVGSDYSFVVTGVTPDGAGHGTVWLGSDTSDAGTQVGEITLNKGSADDLITFYKDDGTPGEQVKFKFNV